MTRIVLLFVLLCCFVCQSFQQPPVLRVVAECGAPYVVCSATGPFGFSIEVWKAVTDIKQSL
jgi:hypothetical protein